MANAGISRRDALRKLGFGILAGYVVPEILVISTAAASSGPSEDNSGSGSDSDNSGSGSDSDNANSSSSSSVSDISEPSSPVSDPSTPEASLPSGPSEVDWRDDDTCGVHSTRGNQVTISNSDFARAQRAVANGEALPLSEVFESVQKQVRGQFIEVRFSNVGVPPIYQFRMVSKRGKLITVFTDASSAEILRIVNC